MTMTSNDSAAEIMRGLLSRHGEARKTFHVKQRIFRGGRQRVSRETIIH
jgi:hypothetical protein